jgi:ssDNA-binding Zn-finger/Zn-ribbon topoisomerase 1
MKCPLCGSPMIVRRKRNTREAFLGCTRYLLCKGTRPVAQPGLWLDPSEPKPSQPAPKALPEPSQTSLIGKRLSKEAIKRAARMVNKTNDVKPW